MYNKAFLYPLYHYLILFIPFLRFYIMHVYFKIFFFCFHQNLTMRTLKPTDDSRTRSTTAVICKQENNQFTYSRKNRQEELFKKIHHRQVITCAKKMKNSSRRIRYVVYISLQLWILKIFCLLHMTAQDNNFEVYVLSPGEVV